MLHAPMPTTDADPLPTRYAALEVAGAVIVFDQADSAEGWIQSTVAVSREQCR